MKDSYFARTIGLTIVVSANLSGFGCCFASQTYVLSYFAWTFTLLNSQICVEFHQNTLYLDSSGSYMHASIENEKILVHPIHKARVETLKTRNKLLQWQIRVAAEPVFTGYRSGPFRSGSVLVWYRLVPVWTSFFRFRDWYRDGNRYLPVFLGSGNYRSGPVNIFKKYICQ